jgi:hypothetical protein
MYPSLAVSLPVCVNGPLSDDEDLNGSTEENAGKAACCSAFSTIWLVLSRDVSIEREREVPPNQ